MIYLSKKEIAKAKNIFQLTDLIIRKSEEKTNPKDAVQKYITKKSKRSKNEKK